MSGDSGERREPGGESARFGGVFGGACDWETEWRNSEDKQSAERDHL